MLPQILPLEDKDMARVVERTFKRQGINVLTGAPIADVVDSGKSVKFKVGDTEGEADYLAIAGGRAPDTEPLNLAGAKVETEESGRIKVDDFQRTSNQKVFAVGDLVRGPALAHKAMEEGVVAAETIAGAPTHPVDVALVPGATFCHPQVASRRADRGRGQGGRPRRQGRQAEARRRRRLGHLRRPRGHGQDRRRRRSTARSSAPTSSATAPAT